MSAPESEEHGASDPVAGADAHGNPWLPAGVEVDPVGVPTVRVLGDLTDELDAKSVEANADLNPGEGGREPGQVGRLYRGREHGAAREERSRAAQAKADARSAR